MSASRPACQKLFLDIDPAAERGGRIVEKAEAIMQQRKIGAWRWFPRARFSGNFGHDVARIAAWRP